MIAGLDSSNPPTAAQVAAAKAAGVSLWSGYLSTQAGVKLYRPWTDAEFLVAAKCGSPPIAYCSGWDNPAACKARAERLGVRLCLDVESQIRDLGPWTQGFLDASGAGLYGNAITHKACRAPFRVLYGTYGYDPRATWRGTPPAEPHAFQWWNSHVEFGVTVDRNWMDDWFSQPIGDDMTPEEHNMLVDNHNRLTNIEQWAGALQVGGRIDAAIQYAINDPNVGLATLKAELDALKAQLGGLSSVPGPPGKQGDPGPPGPPPATGTTFTAKIGG